MRKLTSIVQADSFGLRLTGLMGRKDWPVGVRGIHFPHCTAVHTFFTFLRPDLLFLTKNNKILTIFPSAGPWRFFFGPSGSRDCLEIPRGTVRKLGLKKGDFIQIKR